MSDAAGTRKRSRERLASAGLPQPPDDFPLLWKKGDVLVQRDLVDLVERIAVLNIVINCSFGMPPPLALAWLTDNRLDGFLTARERQVVTGELGVVEADRMQTEAINTLAWLVGAVETLDFKEPCPDSLATVFPELRRGESFSVWRRRVATHARSPREVVQEWDFHRCMSWVIADAFARQVPSPGPLPALIYLQRRRGLEYSIFIKSDERAAVDWDHVSLALT